MQTNFATPAVTITSYPGERATVAGFPYITGTGDTFSNLNFDLNKTGDVVALCQGGIGRGASITFPFEIEASNVTVAHSDVTVDPSVPLANRGLGIGVGFSFSTSGDVITNNRIHDVGYCPVEEHGIYLNHTSGTQVSGNWIYDIPAGTGIQVWDGPSNTRIFGNVIDGASSCFDLGGNTPVTTNNMIEHNICSNTVGVQAPYAAFCNSPGPGCTGPDVGAPLFDYWSSGTAAGNVMQNNLAYCASTAHCTTSFSNTSGVSLSGNITADPQFADPNYQTTHNYQLAPTSPAASWGLWNGDTTTIPAPPVVTPPVVTPPVVTPPVVTPLVVKPPPPVATIARVPTGITVTGGNSQVSVKWAADAASDNVTHYNVYRTDQTFSGAWATPTGTTFTNVANVVNGTSYCYQVSASNSNGESAKSAPVCATPKGPGAHHRRQSLVGVNLTGGNRQVVVKWTANAASDNVTHDNVYRTDQTFSAAWATPTGTAFTNTSKVFNGTRYCYQVSATNSIGESAKSTAVCVPALTALPAGFTTSRQSAR